MVVEAATQQNLARIILSRSKESRRSDVSLIGVEAHSDGYVEREGVGLDLHLTYLTYPSYPTYSTYPTCSINHTYQTYPTYT
jgi:hypothetical protein